MRKDGVIQSDAVTWQFPSLGATDSSQAATVEAGLFSEDMRGGRGRRFVGWKKGTPQLRVLGLKRDMDRLATDDELKRRLQNLELLDFEHDAALPGGCRTGAK
jgi:hypothetical protein